MSTQTITISQTLRPIRLAFLVRRDDVESVRQVIKINTMLWGGMLNPIIPVGSAGALDGETPEAYLDAFAPDVVIVGPGCDEPAHIPKDRRISLDEFTSDFRDRRHGSFPGLRMENVYQHLHDESFRFVQRMPQKVTLPRPSDERLEMLVAAFAGSFPDDASEAWFQQALGAEPTSFTFAEPAVERRYLTPMLATVEACSAFRPVGPWLFFMDGDELEDVIAFWNIRASGIAAHPIPVSRWSDCQAGVNAFMAQHASASSGAHPLRARPSLVKSRTIGSAEFEAVRAGISDGSELGHYVKDAPDLWHRREWRVLGSRSSTASAPTRRRFRLEGGSLVSLDPLLPDFYDAAETRLAPVVANC
jgi:hypothetical protein